jgi:YidC/Oxa1 family membrane protein insertase
MEKRTIFAIALSVLILFAFKYYEERKMAERRAAQPTAAEQTAAKGQQPVPESPPAAPAPAPAEASALSIAASPDDTQATQQKLVIEGDLYRAVLDNRGALLTSWELLQYKTARGGTFEMIAAAHDAETRPYLGSLLLDDPSLSSAANGGFYVIQVEGSAESSGVLVPPVTVTMKLRHSGLSVEKTWRFEKDNYLVSFALSAERDGKPLAGRFLLGQDIGPESEHLLGSTAQLQAISYRDAKVRRDSPPKEENQIQKMEGDVRWVGLDMHYFSIIAIPAQPLPAFEMTRRPAKAVGLDGKEVARDLLRLTIPTSGSGQYRIYIGPKKPSYLDAAKAIDLSGVINYGWFTILVLPLLASLQWINQFIHNYGYSIILLTLILTLLLFPFRLKQIFSMKKMQVVQPKVKAIQEKYKRYKKTDPKRAEMNQEIMALYKEHNVNPLGGCLPLLLQFPILIAFYNLLAFSIDLRQAPFIGWIHDLSIKDPYYLLPIVMGITMLISQKMTPMAPGTDPTQAKMMLIMPVIFTVMFLNVSSGLNLYFLCSNVFQIGFQKIAERWIGDRESGDKS